MDIRYHLGDGVGGNIGMMKFINQLGLSHTLKKILS